MKRESGFTLLEILAVISLMGLLLALVGTAIVAANRSVAAAERTSVRLDDIRATHRFLRQSISQTLPLSAAKREDVPADTFLGKGDALSFYAPLPNSLGGGLYLHQLYLDQQRLQVRLARLAGEQLESWGEPQRLLDDVSQVRFSYRGHSPLGKQTAWLDHWPWPKRLPHAVRISLRLRDSDGWVTQQVSLRLDLSGEVGGS